MTTGAVMMTATTEPVEFAGAAGRPGRIGAMTLRNRLILAPMVTVLAGTDGEVTTALVRHYVAMAKSGIGAVIVESTLVNEAHDDTMPINELHLSAERHVPGMAWLAESIREQRARPILQINCHRRYGPDVSAELLEAIVKDFGAAAVRAKRAGFAGVEIHSCHNNFLCDIIHPKTNGRDDRYGGDIERNANVAAALVREVKQRTEGKLAAIVRLNGADYTADGLVVDDATRIARHLEAAGADALHVTGGLTENGLAIITPDRRKEPGWLARELARPIKAAVRIPVIGVSRINSLAVANALIDDAVCDFAAIGRALLADPAMLREGRESRCIYCNKCTRRVMGNRPIRCAVNDELGR